MEMPNDAPWWARWMVENWREAKRWLSVQLALLCAAGCQLDAAYPDQINEAIANAFPATWRPHILSAIFLVIAIARLKNQTPKGPQ